MLNALGVPIAFASFFADLMAQNAAVQKAVSETQEKQTSTDHSHALASALADAKRRCRMSSAKPSQYMFCLEKAKDRILHPPKPPPPRTELQKELARCEMMGKPVQIWNCKRDAPKRIEARKKAAEDRARSQSQTTPLERALNRCRGYSKAIQIFQCTTEARKKFGPRAEK